MKLNLYWKYVIVIFGLSLVGCFIYQFDSNNLPRFSCVSWLTSPRDCDFSQALKDTLWLFLLMHLATVGLIPLCGAWVLCKSHKLMNMQDEI